MALSEPQRSLSTQFKKKKKSNFNAKVKKVGLVLRSARALLIVVARKGAKVTAHTPVLSRDHFFPSHF